MDQNFLTSIVIPFCKDGRLSMNPHCARFDSMELGESLQTHLLDALAGLYCQRPLDAFAVGPTWASHSAVMSAAEAPSRSSNAWGETSTWAPILPPEMKMVS